MCLYECKFYRKFQQNEPHRAQSHASPHDFARIFTQDGKTEKTNGWEQ